MKIHITSSEESISASYQNEEFGLSVASADKIFDGTWYVSRVMVNLKHRGKKIGSLMLNKIIDEIKSRPDKGNIVVFPGGYSEDLEKQMNFYKKNGFVDGDKPGMLIYNI